MVGPAILVIDDIKINRMIINQMLKKLHLSANFQKNGIEAIKAVKNRQYDLIFMDCRMPKMDGFRATCHIRKQGCKVPIIALTACSTSEEYKRCIRSGMDDVLVKPYTVDNLENMINKWS
ncbi:response regulator [Candidatus Photodesmus blepharus]|uniref:response regulator n=1 Tax=Candidatus Photodesmus blepharonis TaxID=1179155 RepID=UPI00054E8E98|nr:response regulator [Candidatus Photodesmus blepharus]